MWKQQQIDQQQLGFICGSERITDLVVKHFSIFNILVFETLGSLFISYMIVMSGGFFSYIDFNTFNIILGIGSYFIAYLISNRFCKSILNPVIVIAYMIKKQNKLSLLSGSLYLIAQFIGTIIGTVVGFQVCNNFQSPAMEYLIVVQQTYTGGQLFFQSAISSFLFIVTIMIVISSDITFVEIQFQTLIVIPLIYAFTALLSNDTLGPNFFLGLIASFFGSYYTENWKLISQSWPMITGPFVGGIIGAVFFQFVYRHFAYAYKQELRIQQKILQQIEEERLKKLKRQTVLQLI